MKSKSKKRFILKWILIQSKPAKLCICLLVISGVFIAFVNIGMTAVLQEFVDIAVCGSASLLRRNTFLALLFLVCEGILRLISAVAYRMSCAKIIQELRKGLFEKIYDSSLIDLQQSSVGEYMTNLTTDAEKVSECVPAFLRKTIGNAATAVLAVIYLFLLNWKLALILLICVPLLIVCIMAFSPIVQRTSRTDQDNEEAIRVYLQDIIDKMPILKVYRMKDRFYEKTGRYMHLKRKSSAKLGCAEGGAEFLNNILGTTMFLIAMGVAPTMLRKGNWLLGP